MVAQGADPKAGASGEAKAAQAQTRGVSYGADVLTTLAEIWEYATCLDSAW